MDPRPRISETVHCPCEVKGLGEISNDSKLRIIWVGCFSHKVLTGIQPLRCVLCMYYRSLRVWQGDVKLMRKVLVNQTSFHRSRLVVRTLAAPEGTLFPSQAPARVRQERQEHLIGIEIKAASVFDDYSYTTA